MFMFMRHAFQRAKERSHKSSHGGGSRHQHRRRSSGSSQGLKLCGSSNSGVLEDFHQAVKDNDLEKVEECLEDVHDLDATTKTHCCTALSVAVEKEFVEIVELLLESGASPNSQKSRGTLILACEERNTAIAQLLLNYGADCNLEDYYGVTALVLAARQGDMEIVRLLLNYGADVNHKTNYEYLPLGIRWSLDYPDAPKDFCAELCEPFYENTALMGACREHHLEIVRELLAAGADIHQTNSIGNTALHIAAYAKSQLESYYPHTSQSFEPLEPTCPEVVTELLCHGGNVLTQNMCGETPLDRAMTQIKLVQHFPAGGGNIKKSLSDYFLILCHLIKAGSPLPSAMEDKSSEEQDFFILVTKAFLQLQADAVDDKSFQEAFIDVVKTATYSGVKPDEKVAHEIKNSMNESQIKQDLLEWLQEVNSTGFTLKQLCRVKLRQMIKPPLTLNVMLEELDLPSILKQYLLLDHL